MCDLHDVASSFDVYPGSPIELDIEIASDTSAHYILGQT